MAADVCAIYKLSPPRAVTSVSRFRRKLKQREYKKMNMSGDYIWAILLILVLIAVGMAMAGRPIWGIRGGGGLPYSAGGDDVDYDGGAFDITGAMERRG